MLISNKQGHLKKTGCPWGKFGNIIDSVKLASKALLT